MKTDRITWRQTRELLRLDLRRLLELRSGRLFLYPPALCVRLYRMSRYLHCRGYPRLTRLIWQVNLILTGADIWPSSRFGGGLVLTNPMGVSLAGSAGNNLTVMAQAGLGGETGRERDVGAGPGLPLLGDDVHLAPAAGVLGPVRIGNRVFFAPGCIASRDVPDDTAVSRTDDRGSAP